jgi:hypothetical protein
MHLAVVEGESIEGNSLAADMLEHMLYSMM